METENRSSNGGDPFGIKRFLEEDLFGAFSPLGFLRNVASVDQPRIRTSEQNDKFVIRVEVPGFEQDQIRIDTQGRKITISGSRENSDGGVLFSRFESSFTMPQSVVVDEISAILKSGILTIDLPKNKEITSGEKKRVKIRTK